MCIMIYSICIRGVANEKNRDSGDTEKQFYLLQYDRGDADCRQAEKADTGDGLSGKAPECCREAGRKYKNRVASVEIPMDEIREKAMELAMKENYGLPA